MKKNVIDLKQLSVLVTRPFPQGKELSEAIQKANGRVIYFPTILIAPEELVVIADQLLPLGRFDWLIFLSPAAVVTSIRVIEKIPANLKIAAVGEGTQKALKNAGLRVDVFPEENWSSEGLLALPEFQFIQNKKIALIRGTGGRDHLKKILSERGAEVIDIFSYQRLLSTNDNVNDCIRLLNRGEINCIVCTSNQGIENLKKIVGKIMWSFLCIVPLLVVSERQKTYAAALGFKTILVAKNASHDVIIETLQRGLEKLCQKKNLHQNP